MPPVLRFVIPRQSAAEGDYRKVGNGTTTRALRFVSILKEALPWVSFAMAASASKTLSLYDSAKLTWESFVSAAVTVVASIVAWSHHWVFLWGASFFASWSLGWIDVWYTSKPLKDFKPLDNQKSLRIPDDTREYRLFTGLQGLDIQISFSKNAFFFFSGLFSAVSVPILGFALSWNPLMLMGAVVTSVLAAAYLAMFWTHGFRFSFSRTVFLL